ncbi:MAG: 50S ribosomal protein L30 [Candidatus Pacearchaeota archaeon]|nr:50S ribosomal protein L30 [Candidatus Pacearchaeota archaeon]
MKIAAIRIRGIIGVRKQIEDTLNKLRLRKKFVCVILDDRPEILGMLKKVQNYIAYGPINKETLKLLLMERARMPGNKKITIAGKNLENFLEEFLSGRKKLQDLGIKPFFRLHPPRGGFKKSIKLMYPKGILGYNKEINELIRRMI